MQNDCKFSCKIHLKGTNIIKIHLQHFEKLIVQQSIQFAIQYSPTYSVSAQTNFLLKDSNIEAWGQRRRTTQSGEDSTTPVKSRVKSTELEKRQGEDGSMVRDSTLTLPPPDPVTNTRDHTVLRQTFRACLFHLSKPIFLILTNFTVTEKFKWLYSEI